jgi:hypothetical protein
MPNRTRCVLLVSVMARSVPRTLCADAYSRAFTGSGRVFDDNGGLPALPRDDGYATYGVRRTDPGRGQATTRRQHSAYEENLEVRGPRRPVVLPVRQTTAATGTCAHASGSVPVSCCASSYLDRPPLQPEPEHMLQVVSQCPVVLLVI